MRENILHITLISIPTINFIITFFLFTKVAPSTAIDAQRRHPKLGIKISTQIAHPSLLPVPVYCSPRVTVPGETYHHPTTTLKTTTTSNRTLCFPSPPLPSSLPVMNYKPCFYSLLFVYTWDTPPLLRCQHPDSDIYRNKPNRV